jgi:hypothetical protein
VSGRARAGLCEPGTTLTANVATLLPAEIGPLTPAAIAASLHSKEPRRLPAWSLRQPVSAACAQSRLGSRATIASRQRFCSARSPASAASHAQAQICRTRGLMLYRAARRPERAKTADQQPTLSDRRRGSKKSRPPARFSPSAAIGSLGTPSSSHKRNDYAMRLYRILVTDGSRNP